MADAAAPAALIAARQPGPCGSKVLNIGESSTGIPGGGENRAASVASVGFGGFGGLGRADDQVAHLADRQRLAAEDLLAAQDDAESGIDIRLDPVEQFVLARVGG